MQFDAVQHAVRVSLAGRNLVAEGLREAARQVEGGTDLGALQRGEWVCLKLSGLEVSVRTTHDNASELARIRRAICESNWVQAPVKNLPLTDHGSKK